MLDTCSTGSFVLEDIADSLGIKGADTRLTGKTMNGRQLQDTKIQNGSVFSDLRGKNRVQLPKVFTSEDLSQREDLFSHKVVHKWKHLKSTADDLPPQIPGAKIGLFITQTHSQDDKKFLKIVSDGTRHTNDNHYEIPLPFRIKQERKEVKCYGEIFTCLASRAVHIEAANSLETDSFLNALWRFIARRGPVRDIRSDQGTNIVGAKNKLGKGLKEMGHGPIQRYLSAYFYADWEI